MPCKEGRVFGADMGDQGAVMLHALVMVAHVQHSQARAKRSLVIYKNGITGDLEHAWVALWGT